MSVWKIRSCVPFYWLLALVVIGCMATPSTAAAEGTLYGTWINEEIPSVDGYRMVYAPDGKAFSYTKFSKGPESECRFTIEKQWTDDEGNTYYRVIEIWGYPPLDASQPLNTDLGPWKFFRIHKIDAAGDTMETVGSNTEFPEEFSPAAGDYFIHYREK